MDGLRKLDRWAEKLLDTGKRNNLINFRDTKASSAQIVYPDTNTVFSKCSIGHVFEIYDPKIQDLDEDDNDNSESNAGSDDERMSKSAFTNYYSKKVSKDKQLLIYAQTPNPLTAVKNIAKKAQQMLDETGINVAYLAFGFVRWSEKEGSSYFYNAPLLLVHVTLTTGSILDPIKIEISDDDVVVNPTYNYLLQAEYGLSLPDFNDGDDLLSYYGKVSDTVKKLGWSVTDECKLGIFSFLKINMYEDLQKNANLILKNKNIRAIMGDAGSNGFQGLPGEEHVVQNPLIDLHMVVDADSSQIEAIEMAKSGRSFVLQGPPGTGKSQTITNIIAECLHDGKKILFVSEKQAALNVVFDKLKKNDLDDFCLELHSHKANKKAVIEELNRTLEIPKSRVSSSAEQEIDSKRKAQLSLDTYAADLHKKRDVINKSLYQLFELYAAQRKYPEYHIQIKNIGKKDQLYFNNAISLLEQYENYVPSIGNDYRENPWYGFIDYSLDYDGRNQLNSDFTNLISDLTGLGKTIKELKQKYDIDSLDYYRVPIWQSFLQFISNNDVITPMLLKRENYEKYKPAIKQLQYLGETYTEKKEEFTKVFDASIFDEMDGADFTTTLKENYSSFFSRLFNGEYKDMIATLRAYLHDDQKLSYEEAITYGQNLEQLQADLVEYKACEEQIVFCLGDCYSGLDTDWEHVWMELDKLEKYYKYGIQRFGSISDMDLLTFKQYSDLFADEAAALGKDYGEIDEIEKRLSSQFDPGIFDIKAESGVEICAKLQHCLNEFDMLSNWLSFSQLLDKLKAAELDAYIDTAIYENIKPDSICGVYKKAFYKQWIEYVVFSVPELSSFSRVKHDLAVRNFKEKDGIQYEISKAQIKAELSQKRPNLDMVAGGSSVAILRREHAKKRKQMPIRKLLSEIGDVVQIIKPCFLMSPLSVSTFLDPNQIHFDTVIFDEASQIFPQDAIGAIYRGDQVIVVGDSKQMPPSNFFNSTLEVEDEEEEIGDISDFESILDICSSVFDTKRLSWHYRSHFEQLISFSNLNFYNNTLVTFPSSAKDHRGIGVDFYYVGGTFDRKSKTNRGEAEFIVNQIFNQIDEHPERSLGVVAFSVAQQNLIDKLLSKRREMDSSYEWFFRNDAKEPFFIKNLETVQGDERDTIIFSVAYAKDAQGRFIQNFGPLNRVGGERRLNVAVTRAKDNIQLVSSILSTDINLSNTGSEGVRLLRAYLDFAQHGEVALERNIKVSSEDHYDSYFEQEVCDFLRDKGYTVDTQVGCSGYKIDLALRKPDSSNYLLAIECDGATYHNSKNARDRDRLRQEVLENMGWKFYRIWSTDWFRNNTIEKSLLVAAVDEALKTDNSQEKDKQNTISRNAPPGPAQQTKEPVFSEIQQNQHEFEEYKMVDAIAIVRSNGYNLSKSAAEIIKIEGPLSEEFFLKRIVTLFNREKVTSVVLKKYNGRMYHCSDEGIERRNGFLYLKKEMNNIKFRVPGVRRDVKYISVEELSEGFYEIIKQNVSVTREGLYKTMTNLLGFSRTGDAIVERYNLAITLLMTKHLIVMENGILSTKKN